MHFGPLEFFIIVLNVLLFIFPVVLVFFLIRAYQKRREKGMKDELDGLKQKVKDMENRSNVA
ncbi:hypothetical protein DGWBC_1148 [Dehalogenimonas sp. WBC-2]|nr:hypothetical protein DGWBC_1148 [Dehalogenimonas sp. WBC-2]